jgi:predicted transcriptional regulator
MSKTDKVFMIALLIEPYTLLEFSPTEYSNYLGVSRATIYRSMDKLLNLKILKKHEKRYKYIVDCKLL